MLLCVSPSPPAELEELARWATPYAEWVYELGAGEALSLTSGRLGTLYRDALSRRRERDGGALSPAPLYDVAVRGEELSEELLDLLLTSLERVVVEKGSTHSDWGRTCARSRVALLGQRQDGLHALVESTLSANCLPVVVGNRRSGLAGLSASEASALPLVLELLAQPEELSARLAEARVSACTTHAPVPSSPLVSKGLRIALNLGGLVASELRESLAPLGWELFTLQGPASVASLAPDVLVVLPYGDPEGGLDAVRHAMRAGVPVAFWNVEDPRYFFDARLGPLVRDSAKEATAVFSTTMQLEAYYAQLGVKVTHLPNYGRRYFLRDPLPEPDREVDLLFLGTMTSERRAFLDDLIEALGPAVSVVARDDVRAPGELRELVATARLGLAVGTLTDAPGAPEGLRRGEGLTERLFDYPLAGTPVLTDVRAHLTPPFLPNEDVFVFTDTSTLASLVRELLSMPEDRARVMRSARRKVLAGHLAVHRILTIVETLAAIPGAMPALASAAGALRTKLSSGVQEGREP